MLDSHPVCELSVEQLVHALAQALDSTSPSMRRLLESGLQKISDIERDLHNVLQAMRVIRNTFIPVNRLPPEVFSSVMEHRTGDRDLVAATHVCRYWRSTLTSSPSLWTCFRFRPSHDINIDRVLAYLERSKSVPIDIEMDIDSPRGLEVFEHLAPHIAKTSSFIVGGGLVHATSLLFCSPAPSLKHLEMDSHERYVRLSDNFLGQHAPLLRRIRLRNIHLAFESTFPLPDLTEFNLHLRENAAPFCMSALFHFLSNSPRLKKICIEAPGEMLQDASLDQVISLESLVELQYTCDAAGSILPRLRLPRLEQLSVSSSFGLGQARKLANILPRDSHLLREGATKMEYHAYSNRETLEFTGKGVGVTLSVPLVWASPTPVDWFSDTKYIPFGQIQELTVGYSPNNTDFPVAAFENLEILRIIPWEVPFTEGLFRSLYPGTEVPCRSLRAIEYLRLESLGPLISLVKARLQVGHRLKLVWLAVLPESERSAVAELRELVGEVLIK